MMLAASLVMMVGLSVWLGHVLSRWRAQRMLERKTRDEYNLRGPGDVHPSWYFSGPPVIRVCCRRAAPCPAHRPN